MDKKYRNLNKLDRYRDIIGIETFINNYLATEGDNYICCKKISHAILKELNNPYVMPVSFDLVEANYELILCGKILIVMDCYNHTAPYINPIELRRISSIETLQEQINTECRKKSFGLNELLQKWSRQEVISKQIEEIEKMKEFLYENKKRKQVERIIDHHSLKRERKIKYGEY